MKKKKNLIMFLIIIALLIVLFITGRVVYATMSMDEIVSKLELANAMGMLGDLEQLKQVINTAYNDLISAETIDDSVKTKLKNDIAQLSNVNGLSSSIVEYLQSEFENRIDNLTEENVSQMKSLMTTVNNWVNTEVENKSTLGDDKNGETDETGNLGTETENDKTSEDGNNGDAQQLGQPQITTENTEEDVKTTTIKESEIEQEASRKIPNTGAEQMKTFLGIVIISITLAVSIVGCKELKEI